MYPNCPNSCLRTEGTHRGGGVLPPCGSLLNSRGKIIFPAGRDRQLQEPFPGSSDKQRITQLCQFIEIPEQLPRLLSAFREA